MQPSSLVDEDHFQLRENSHALKLLSNLSLEIDQELAEKIIEDQFGHCFEPHNHDEARDFMAAAQMLMTCQFCGCIPINQRCCIQCKEIVCESCLKSRTEAGLGCGNRECAGSGDLILEEVAEKSRLKLTKMLRTKHVCDPNPQNEGQFEWMTVQELRDHKIDCAKSSFCGLCLTQFGSRMELKEHLRKECPDMEQICFLCSQSFKRKSFFKSPDHHCEINHVFA